MSVQAAASSFEQRHRRPWPNRLLFVLEQHGLLPATPYPSSVPLSPTWDRFNRASYPLWQQLHQQQQE
jgi:hypothetical protein